MLSSNDHAGRTIQIPEETVAAIVQVGDETWVYFRDIPEAVLCVTGGF